MSLVSAIASLGYSWLYAFVSSTFPPAGLHHKLTAYLPLQSQPSPEHRARKPPQRRSKTVDSVRYAVSQPVVAAFCAGGVAGAVSRTVVSPLERLKILFQVQSAGRDAYQLSVGKSLAKIWRDEGWRGFMRGNGTNCIRIIPYSAVQFGSYNFYKRVSRRRCALSWETLGGRLHTDSPVSPRISSNPPPAPISLPSRASFAAAARASPP
jgi:hypothetical protein